MARLSIGHSDGFVTTDEMQQIGEVAEHLGLSLRTIRYYEEEGLVTPTKRTEGGFRLYAEEDVERLALVKRMKPLGFSVQEMRELLTARDEIEANGAEAEDALGRLSKFAAAVEEKCDGLRARLAMGEEFARQLEAEHHRYRRRRSRADSPRP